MHDAYYIRRATKKPGLWLVKDYYTYEKTLKMSGMFSDDSFKTGQGSFQYYYRNGRLEKEGNYTDGKKHGLWMGYDEHGNTTDSSLFNDGMPYLFSYRWNDKHIIFKGTYDSLGKGSGTETEYYDYEKGKVSSSGIFSEAHKKAGIWNYYYKSGGKSCIGHFRNDSLLTIECYKEDGTTETDSCKEEILPKAPYDFNKFLYDNLHFPEDVRDDFQGKKLKLYTRAIVQFVVNESGAIENIEVIKHTLPELDSEAMRVMKLMPNWLPGKDHNRPVKTTFTLPIVFKID